jgi:hypothetical protein
VRALARQLECTAQDGLAAGELEPAPSAQLRRHLDHERTCPVVALSGCGHNAGAEGEYRRAAKDDADVHGPMVAGAGTRGGDVLVNGAVGGVRPTRAQRPRG